MRTKDLNQKHNQSSTISVLITFKGNTMSTINDYEAAEEEAFDRIERKFSSSNSIDVTRATITKEEQELAKAFIAKREYNKYF